MKIEIIAIGTQMPSWVNTAYEDYEKRLPKHFGITLKELPLPKRQKSSNVAALVVAEGEQMLAHIEPGDWVIALDVKGHAFSTLAFSQEITTWQLKGNPIKLLIGGPDGLAKACLKRANQSWSLSALTLPHPLVRILLIEQWYRAYTLLTGHPYHR